MASGSSGETEFSTHACYLWRKDQSEVYGAWRVSRSAIDRDPVRQAEPMTPTGVSHVTTVLLPMSVHLFTQGEGAAKSVDVVQLFALEGAIVRKAPVY